MPTHGQELFFPFETNEPHLSPAVLVLHQLPHGQKKKIPLMSPAFKHCVHQWFSCSFQHSSLLLMGSRKTPPYAPVPSTSHPEVLSNCCRTFFLNLLIANLYKQKWVIIRGNNPLLSNNPLLTQCRGSHRMTEWVMLEETTAGHLVQPPCSCRVIPEHMALDCVQEVLKHLQWGRLYNLFGQSVPVCGNLHSKEVLFGTSCPWLSALSILPSTDPGNTYKFASEDVVRGII